MTNIEPDSSQGLRLLQTLIAQGRYIFSIDEAEETASSIGISTTQLNKLLSTLAKKQWLVRLRRGLYAGTGSLPGTIQVHPFAIATRLTEPSAISHWTAMQHHGLTEQIPQIITAVTPKKVITPSMYDVSLKTTAKHMWQILGVHYEYITIKPEHFFGIEQVWVDEHFRIPITDKERTLLDGFIYPKLFGGMGAILEVLETYQQEIDIKKLVAYAVQYGKKSVIKRLGWSLEYFGIPEQYLKLLLDIPVKRYSALDPTQPAKGSCDKRWMIQNNLIKVNT